MATNRFRGRRRTQNTISVEEKKIRPFSRNRICPYLVANSTGMTENTPVAGTDWTGGFIVYADTIQDLRQIRRVCIEMLQAWYGGDPDLMQRVLHDDLAESGIFTDPVTGQTSVRKSGKTQMIEGARRGDGIMPEEQWDIEATILDATETTATVKVRSAYLVDVCQVVKIDKQWQIINVLWTARRTPPWL